MDLLAGLDHTRAARAYLPLGLPLIAVFPSPLTASVRPFGFVSSGEGDFFSGFFSAMLRNPFADREATRYSGSADSASDTIWTYAVCPA